MKKVPILVLVIGMLSGCSPLNKPYYNQSEYQKPDNSKQSPSVVSVPINPTNFSWTSPVNGRLLLKNLGKSPEKRKDESKVEYLARVPTVEGMIFSSLSYHIFDYNPDSEVLSFSSVDPNELGRRAFSYTENGDYSDLNKFFALGMTGGASYDKGKYVGTNAFGVSVVVSKTSSTDYNVVIGTKDPFENARIDFDNVCKIPPQEYRKNKDNLAIEYLAKLRYPFVFKGYKGNSPTINDPSDDSGDIYFFRADLLAARLIDSQTMKVYPCGVKYTITAQ